MATKSKSTTSPKPSRAAKKTTAAEVDELLGDTLEKAKPSGAAEKADNDRTRKRDKVQEAARDIRLTHWPEVKENELWILDGNRGGFAQVPRTLSMITNVIKEAVKRKTGKSSAAGSTYIVLWLHIYGQGLAKVDDEVEAAFEAGYGGERAKSTFRSHIATLKDLGFVDHAAGSRGPYQWVLLFNPYQVLKKLYEQGLVSKTQYVAVRERSMAIGSGDELKGSKDEQ